MLWTQVQLHVALGMLEAKLGRRVAGWTHLFLLGSTGMFISR